MGSEPGALPGSVDGLRRGLQEASYFASPALATAAFLALRLARPLLLEGEAGVGKTQIAKTLATVLDRRLIRLQCHEGLDVHSALYEWDFSRQMLHLRLLEAAGEVDPREARRRLYDREFLLERPLLQALQTDPKRGAPVLLIDELDRADDEFEAFLLEILSEFEVTVPELGTLAAETPPVVVITSNRTREVHDALRRRCLYHWIDYPDAGRELEIVRARNPGVGEGLSSRIVAFVQRLRQEDLYKRPGVAETLDWARALTELGHRELDAEAVEQTLGALIKYQDDAEQLTRDKVSEILAAVG